MSLGTFLTSGRPNVELTVIVTILPRADRDVVDTSPKIRGPHETKNALQIAIQLRGADAGASTWRLGAPRIEEVTNGRRPGNACSDCYQEPTSGELGTQRI
jgi:hypothetical protein